MLFYHGNGPRDYARQPHPIRRRQHWECAAILSGRARPTWPPDHPAPPELADTRPALWIFPPGDPHGWVGDRPCQVLIAHLASLPRLVADAVEAQGCGRWSLRPAEIARLRATDRLVTDLLRQRPDAGEVAADLLRGECALIAARRLPRRASRSDDERLVKEALVWFEGHLDQGVGVAAVARAVGLSPAHFRRLVHQVGGQSPRDLLTARRIDRARDLLRRSDESLEEVALASGFASASALSEAFRRATGQRPGAWRGTARSS